jgi:hypothetical protein
MRLKIKKSIKNLARLAAIIKYKFKNEKISNKNFILL